MAWWWYPHWISNKMSTKRPWNRIVHQAVQGNSIWNATRITCEEICWLQRSIAPCGQVVMKNGICVAVSGSGSREAIIANLDSCPCVPLCNVQSQVVPTSIFQKSQGECLESEAFPRIGCNMFCLYDPLWLEAQTRHTWKIQWSRVCVYYIS